MTLPITREPLRTAVRRVLLDRLMSGELEPGSNINEGDLCEELGVSRTPLRQALLTLEFEGFVDSEQGKGFWVVPLTREAATELYSLVGALEALALEWSPRLEQNALDELEYVNRQRAKLDTDEVDRRIELDNRWHSLLIGGCPNGQLLKVLGLLKNRLYRYEHAIARGIKRAPQSTAEHEAIHQAVVAGELDRATALLEQHWCIGIKSVETILNGDSDGHE